VNYELKFGMCPSNCQKDSSVIGRGIHPPTSTICGSAIADGAMPKSGGCVGIGKVVGQSGYAKAKDTNGIKIELGGDADWSFVLFKVDNPDFAKSDIRILVITH